MHMDIVNYAYVQLTIIYFDPLSHHLSHWLMDETTTVKNHGQQEKTGPVSRAHGTERSSASSRLVLAYFISDFKR